MRKDELYYRYRNEATTYNLTRTHYIDTETNGQKVCYDSRMKRAYLISNIPQFEIFRMNQPGII